MNAKVIKINLGTRLILIFNLLLVFSPSAIADEVSKEVWVDAMKSELPTVFCHSMHFFRQCFDINEDQCIETASLSTRICLHKYITQIPDVLKQPNDGARWGNIVGQCAGENFHATMSRKYKDTKECKDINHWK